MTKVPAQNLINFVTFLHWFCHLLPVWQQMTQNGRSTSTHSYPSPHHNTGQSSFFIAQFSSHLIILDTQTESHISHSSLKQFFSHLMQIWQLSIEKTTLNLSGTSQGQPKTRLPQLYYTWTTDYIDVRRPLFRKAPPLVS